MKKISMKYFWWNIFDKILSTFHCASHFPSTSRLVFHLLFDATNAYVHSFFPFRNLNWTSNNRSTCPKLVSWEDGKKIFVLREHSCTSKLRTLRFWVREKLTRWTKKQNLGKTRKGKTIFCGDITSRGHVGSKRSSSLVMLRFLGQQQNGPA